MSFAEAPRPRLLETLEQLLAISSGDLPRALSEAADLVAAAFRPMARPFT